MNRPEDRIPQDQTQEVFTLAAQLYAQHSQSYSVQELMAAGNEANIPPEFVQQAIAQIQYSARQLCNRYQRLRANGLRFC